MTKGQDIAQAFIDAGFPVTPGRPAPKSTEISPEDRIRLVQDAYKNSKLRRIFDSFDKVDGKEHLGGKVGDRVCGVCHQAYMGRGWNYELKLCYDCTGVHRKIRDADIEELEAEVSSDLVASLGPLVSISGFAR